MIEVVQCLDIDMLQVFLNTIPAAIWSYTPAPQSFVVLSSEYGPVTWLYNETTDLYCHNFGRAT